MGVFNGIEKSYGTKGGRYFQPGIYRVKVAKAILKQDRKNVDMFIAELEVLESNNPEVEIGASISYIVKFDKDPAQGNVADFMRAGLASLSAANGIFVQRDDAELTEDIADEIVGEDNILVGTELAVEAFNKPTRAGNDFTRVIFDVPKDLHDGVRPAGMKATPAKQTQGRAAAR